MQQSNEIRVIAPSSSQRANQKRQYERAKERLESIGYKVTFGRYVADTFHLGTAKPEQRAKDFNDAFSDNNVKAVMLCMADGRQMKSFRTLIGI